MPSLSFYLIANRKENWLNLFQIFEIPFYKEIQRRNWNDDKKLEFLNDYKHVSSQGKNKLHRSGYFSHPLPLHISHRQSL